MRKCTICGKPPMENSIVCSDDCNNVRLLVIELSNEHTPCHGCDNCWGDLHQGCTDKCKEEHKKAVKFIKQLHILVQHGSPTQNK